jgi:intein/homing endonuclease
MTEMPKLKEELYGHFIRGYFDGDGSIYNYFDIYDKRQRWGIEILGTPDFLSKIQKILIKNCNVKETKLHNVNHVKNLTRISYKGIKSLMKIRDFLYENATIYLEYKYKKFYNISPCNW